MSRSLFHYKELVKSHLVLLLTERTVKLTQPNAFNDPWDCRVHFSVPHDKAKLRRLVEWIAEQNRKQFPQSRGISGGGARTNLGQNALMILRSYSSNGNNECTRGCASCTASIVSRNVATVR